MPPSIAGSQGQSSVEEDVALSTLATAGTEYGDPPDISSTYARRPLTPVLGRQAQLQQSAEDDQVVSTRDDMLKWDDSQFRGLTPPPLPDETTRSQKTKKKNEKKKRAIQEIIEDNSPQQAPDRITREIEEMMMKPKQQAAVDNDDKSAEKVGTLTTTQQSGSRLLLSIPSNPALSRSSKRKGDTMA